MMREKCPRCGKAGVRRSASRVKHLWRILRRSARRFCPACGKRWRAERPVRPELVKREELLLAGCIAVTVLMLTLVMHPHALSDWFAAQVRAYRAEHDTTSHQRLWNNFKPEKTPPRYPLPKIKKKAPES